MFSQMYDNFFPIKKIKLKSKDLKNPWITLGIKRSPKCKVRLYNKFLNNGTQRMDGIINILKHSSKQLKSAQKTLLF